LSRQGSSHPLTRPELALGISAKVPREVIRGYMSRKHEYWQFIHGQSQAKSLLQKTAERVGELLNLSRNHIRTITGLLTVHS